MTIQLTPRTLDIIITKITPKTVWYMLTSSGQDEKWKIPPVSIFDTSVLEVGLRYRVDSTVVSVPVWNHLTKKRVNKQRFDWLNAVALVPKAKLTALTTKQRKARDSLAAMPLADNGSLFAW